MRNDKRKIGSILRKIFPVALGASAGFAYWYFIGCTSGSCPITSSWAISTGYGALAGASWLIDPGKWKKKSEEK
ncbi:MAG: hypothetical protein CL946_01475 [Ectothiorhodospiraceae bacterium]|nr:hypothetical protein [Ectothiorhodospiraceae bacterium]